MTSAPSTSAYTPEQKFLAQIVEAGGFPTANKAEQILEKQLSPANFNLIRNQAGPGNAQGSFYDPQQIKVVDLMTNGSASVFGGPAHPAYTADQANALVAKWNKQGEAVSATPAYVAAFAAFLPTFMSAP